MINVRAAARHLILSRPRSIIAHPRANDAWSARKSRAHARASKTVTATINIYLRTEEFFEAELLNARAAHDAHFIRYNVYFV